MSGAWDGVPLNPEKEGFHWVLTPDGENAPYLWRPAGECERGHWPAGWIYAANEWNPADCTYLGPCSTPDQLAAAVHAAYREGWNDREGDFMAGAARIGLDDAALAAARIEGMEAAAVIADECTARTTYAMQVRIVKTIRARIEEAKKEPSDGR